jgi:hypothetical protein
MSPTTPNPTAASPAMPADWAVPRPATENLPGELSAPQGVEDLLRVLAEVKGQAQFLLYLADQIEDSLQQLGGEGDPGHSAFLCRVLTMYSGQLETKYQNLGDKISEASQEVYVTVRDFDLM